jgi:hypothetical protein
MPLADRNFEVQISEDRAAGVANATALTDILGGLEFLHNLGFVHRDLKPANALLHDGRWKLSDLGLVLPPDGQTTTLSGVDSAWGTTLYAAPEQARDFHGVKSAADVYAFGCILHDIFGDGPKRRIPYQTHRAPGPLGWVIEKCTQVKPNKRFTSIDGLRGALLSILQGPTGVTSPTPTAKEWVTELGDMTTWNKEKVEQFAAYLTEQDTHMTRWPICTALSVEVLTALRGLNSEEWDRVAEVYSDWSRGTFGFDYCDVIGPRLEAIFGMADISMKAATAMAAAKLGASHNRWSVMRRVVAMCGPSLPDNVAERIRIEILAERAQEDFRACAKQISLSVDAYHPLIAALLR